MGGFARRAISLIQKYAFALKEGRHQKYIAGSHSEGRGAAAPYGIVMYA